MPGHADAWSAVFADRNAELRDLSRYLHDTVSQGLVTLAFSLSYIESTALPETARAELESAQRMVDNCCREVRLIGSMLAAPSLAEVELHSAIEQLAVFVREDTSIRVTCDLDAAHGLSDDSQVLVMAAVQAWLTLPIRRRAAPEVLIRLRNRPSETILELGMAPPPAGAADGWTALRERTSALGGRFSVTAEPERVSASLYLPEGAAE